MRRRRLLALTVTLVVFTLLVLILVITTMRYTPGRADEHGAMSLPGVGLATLSAGRQGS